MKGKLILLILFLLFVPVHAATLQVCKIGCTYSTIQSALDASASGDRIEVIDGAEYREFINFKAGDTTLISTHPLQKATIAPPYASNETLIKRQIPYSPNSGHTLENFIIKNDIGNQSLCAFIELDGSRSKILKNEFLSYYPFTYNFSVGCANLIEFTGNHSEFAYNTLSVNHTTVGDNRGIELRDSWGDRGHNLSFHDNYIRTPDIYWEMDIWTPNTSIYNNIIESNSVAIRIPANQNSQPGSYYNHTFTNNTLRSLIFSTVEHVSAGYTDARNNYVVKGTNTNKTLHFVTSQYDYSKFNHNLSNNVFIQLNSTDSSYRWFGFDIKDVLSWNDQRLKFNIDVSYRDGILYTSGLKPNAEYFVIDNGTNRGTYITNSNGVIGPITISQTPSYRVFEIRNSTLSSDAPKDVNVTFADSNSSDRLQIEWIDDSTDETGWEVQRSVDNSIWTSVSNITTTTQTSRGSRYTYTSNSLGINSKYYYRVRSLSNNENSDWVYAAPKNPNTSNTYKYTRSNVPGTASFGSVTINSIQPQWTANSNPSGTQYLVERCTSQWAGCIDSGWITSTSHSFTGLSSNTLYSFRVKSRNGDNVESTWTTLGNKATLANTPTNPSHDATDQTTTRIKWTWQSGGGQKDYHASNSGTSGWTTNDFWTQTGLSVNTRYTTTVKARNVEDVNTSTVTHSAYTSIEGYTGIDFGNITTNSIQARPQGTFSNLASGSSGTYIEQASPATNSGWRQNNNYHTFTGLSINTQYCYKVNVRNGDADEIGLSLQECKYTAVNQPIASAFDSVSANSIRANWNANSNPATVQYFAERCTDASFTQNCLNSGWVTSISHSFTALTPNTVYHFRVKSRNGDNVETSYVSLGSKSTLADEISNVVFGAVTTTSLDLTWSSNNPSGTTYFIEHSLDGSGWSEIDQVTQQSYIHNNLGPNSKHYYRVRSKNSENVYTSYANSNPSFKYTQSSQPESDAFGATTINSVEARWKANGNPSGTNYFAERCTDSSFTQNCLNSNWITSLSYTFGGLNPSTRYYFRVKARNGDGVMTTWTNLGSIQPDGVAPSIFISYPESGHSIASRFPIIFKVNDNGGIDNSTCYYNVTSVVNNAINAKIQRQIACPDGNTVVWITSGATGDCKVTSAFNVLNCIVDYTAKDSAGNIGPVEQKTFNPTADIVHNDDFEWCDRVPSSSDVCQISETPFNVTFTDLIPYTVSYLTEYPSGSAPWRARWVSGSSVGGFAAKVGGSTSSDAGYGIPTQGRSTLVSEISVPQTSVFEFGYRVSTQASIPGRRGDVFKFSVEKVGSLLGRENCIFPGGVTEVSGEVDTIYNSVQSANTNIPPNPVHCSVLEPGRYIFRWVYEKNNDNVISGDDSVIVDNFRIQVQP